MGRYLARTRPSLKELPISTERPDGPDRGTDDSLGVVDRAARVAKGAGAKGVAGATVVGGIVARASATGATTVRRRVTREVPEPVRAAHLDSASLGSSATMPEYVDAYASALVASQFLVADFVASRERDEERRERMDRVLTRQRDALSEIGIDAERAPWVLRTFGADLEEADRIGFIVDCYFLDPFAPYTLKSTKTTRNAALNRIAVLVGGDDGAIRRVSAAESSARNSHRKRSLGRIGFIGIGAAVVLGVVGILAAPVAGAALGAAAGLSGAAAVSHGLALLGGGALAAGGAGMAGGMWVVTGVGVLSGLAFGGGGTALYELGSATARGELVKLQITFKLAVLDTNRDMAKAQAVIERLMVEADETRVVLAEERELNEANADRVRTIEETLEAIEETIGWMLVEQREAAELA